MNVRNLTLAIAMLSSTVAFANNRLGSFEDLRNACKDPARYQNQVAPNNIQISCTDVQHTWQPNGNGQITLATRRVVTSAVASDKYSINPVTGEVGAGSQVAACPKFKEVTETVSLSKGLTCDEVLAFPGTAAEYCVALVNDTRAANPGAVQTAPTGRNVDTCGGSATTPPANPPGRGQR